MHSAKTKTHPHCENLRVQFVSSIQSVGIFLAVDSQNLIIQCISQNCFEFFNHPGAESNPLIGEPLLRVLTVASVEQIKKFIDTSSKISASSRVVTSLEFVRLKLTNQTPDGFAREVFAREIFERSVFLYLTQNYVCIESYSQDQQYVPNLLAPNLTKPNKLEIDTQIQFMLSYITQYSGTPAALAKTVCQTIQTLTGFDRVYYCSFDLDGHGYVTADETNSNFESITEHHFPASDLPMIVRKLYLKNRFRSIADSHYEPVPILGISENLQLDNSFFRAISPTHLEYMKSMGAQASASFSVVQGSTLKGLFGCHARQPQFIRLDLFPRIHLLAEAYSSWLLSHQITGREESRSQAGIQLSQVIFEYGNNHCKIASINDTSLQTLARCFDADGILVRSGAQVKQVPQLSSELIQALLHLIDQQPSNRDLFATECLSDLNPEFEKWSQWAAGIVLISLNPDHSEALILLRSETLQKIKWGGDPNSIIDEKPGGISPRDSFNTWIETVRGKCNPWTVQSLTLAKEFRINLLSVLSAYALQLERLNEASFKRTLELETLMSEVHHRVKNNLAILSAIFDWKIRDSKTGDLADCLKEMKSRIRTIASLHQGLYIDKEFGVVDLGRYLRTISNEAIHLVGSSTKPIQVQVEIPPSSLFPASLALPIGLICQEFLVNSIKYAFKNKNEGLIKISLNGSPSDFILKLSDDGMGFPDIANLKSSSIGLNLIKLLTQQIDATLRWVGTNGVSLTIERKGELL